MSGSGLSTARLGRLHAVVAGHVEGGNVPGAVTLVARRGDLHVEAIGTFEAGAGAPMRRDTIFRITAEQKAASAFFPGFWDNRGWGFGASVITRRDGLADVPGRYGWDGGYGTSWYIDPREELVGVLLSQRVMDSANGPVYFREFWTSVYQAIDD